MIRGVLFDMDGVLIDAREWHYQALNEALDLFGMAIEREAHLATFDGLPTRRKLEILSSSRGLPRRLHGFINRLKQERTAELAMARCRPIFQHRYALQRLRDEGMRLGVCSNSVRQSVSLMMTMSQLAPMLDLQLSNEDVAAAKPDPAIYLLAMKKLELRPEETLIVEDNEHGIAAARASGAHVMIVDSPDDVRYGNVRHAIEAVAA